VNFTQMISVRSDHPDALVRLLADWDRNQAETDVMGYIGTHVLADREDPGRYLIIAEFAVVDPDVPAAEEAARNNERPETQEWARKLLEIIEGEPVYRHYDELYRTG
jgi:Antibiotic biosynthesis monooxygenase